MSAQLNIKSDEAYRLASRLAELTGDSLTAVVIKALGSELERAELARDKESRKARLRALAREIRANMDRDATSDHDWLYDADTGLPK